MIWRLPCPVPVFLLVILAIGCNSSAKQVQMEGIARDAGKAAMVQAPPRQPPVQEHAIVQTQHPTIVVRLKAGIDLKILAVTPNPSIDYKIAAATPAPWIDYKMHIVPVQQQLPHVIGELQFPPVPLEPKNQQRSNEK